MLTTNGGAYQRKSTNIGDQTFSKLDRWIDQMKNLCLRIRIRGFRYSVIQKGEGKQSRSKQINEIYKQATHLRLVGTEYVGYGVVISPEMEMWRYFPL